MQRTRKAGTAFIFTYYNTKIRSGAVIRVEALGKVTDLWTSASSTILLHLMATSQPVRTRQQTHRKSIDPEL